MNNIEEAEENSIPMEEREDFNDEEDNRIWSECCNAPTEIINHHLICNVCNKVCNPA